MSPALRHSPLRTAVFGFLAANVLLVGFNIAGATRLVDAAAMQRGVGLVVSLMLMLLGNSLPKLRPLHGSRIDRARGAAAERFAGRLALLAGLVGVAMHAFASLAQARLVASCMGIAAVLVIAATWLRLAYHARSQAEISAPSVDDGHARQRKTTRYLLLAHCYIFCPAWTVHLMGDGPWSADARSWLSFALTMVLMVPVAFIERASPCRRLQTGGS